MVNQVTSPKPYKPKNASYNFVKSQGVAQDYMKVIRQRCENRGVTSEAIKCNQKH